MAHRGIQKLQFVLKAELFEFSASSRKHAGFFTAMSDIDFVDVFHQVCGHGTADMFVQRAAEIVGNVVLAIRESACATEAAHDRAGFTFDAAFYFFVVDRTVSLFKRVAGFKNGNFYRRVFLGQLVGRKNTARSGPDNDNVIVHIFVLLLCILPWD